MKVKKTKAQMSLEMIIGLLILLVVAAVVIQLFLKNITSVDTKKYTQSLKFKQFKADCENLCSDYLANKQDGTIARFCKTKLLPETDLNGDGIKSSKLDAESMAIPMCEDAIYCFHVMSCESESAKIGIQQCRSILCRAYYEVQQDYGEASKAVMDDIPTVGTCEMAAKDVDWWRQWKYGPDPPCGGYVTTTTTTVQSTALSLTCSKSGTDKIYCEWKNCPSTGTVLLHLSNNGGSFTASNKPSDSYTTGQLEAGGYVATLECGGQSIDSPKITI